MVYKDKVPNISSYRTDIIRGTELNESSLAQRMNVSSIQKPRKGLRGGCRDNPRLRELSCAQRTTRHPELLKNSGIEK